MELIEASKRGDIEQVTRLLEQGEIDINAKDEHGRTSLHLASWKGYLGISKLLLAFGANIEAQDDDKQTPLHFACYKEQTANLLLESGANIEAQDENGDTPLYCASWQGD